MMFLFWFLLVAVAIGVIIGFMWAYAKRAILQRAAQDRAAMMSDFDRRYLKIADDVKLLQELGDGVIGKYKNATPEKVARAKELAARFESGWLGKRQAQSSMDTQVSPVTTYELTKMQDELEQLLRDIFSS